MEKFAVDLDKVLDELEENEGKFLFVGNCLEICRL